MVVKSRIPDPTHPPPPIDPADNDRAELSRLLREHARQLGFDALGITTAAGPDSIDSFRAALTAERHGEMAWLARNVEKRADPQHVLPGAQSIVILAISYAPDQTANAADATDATDDGPDPHNHGVVARYARHSDYHDVLAPPLRTLSAWLDQQGGPGSRSLWYVDTGPILERDLAQRAGVGFIGKHTNLISPSLGNWFFLAEILTTVALEPGRPATNHCGHCTRCLTACPTNALTAPFTLDSRRCISYLTIELKGSIPEALRPLIGNRIYGCDDCLAACPWNRFARAGRLMTPARRPDLDQPGLLELLQLDAVAFKALFAGTPMLRTKRRGLLRNVCVALGNTGTPDALAALAIASEDPEPLIAEHATWALREIRRRYQITSPDTGTAGG